MTPITTEQLVAALATLGIRPSASGPAVRDAHNNNSSEVVEGPLHSFYCLNCAYPNVISLNAIPTLIAIANHHKALPSASPAPRSSVQPSAPSAGVAPASAGTPATSASASQVAANAPPSTHAVHQGSAPPSITSPSVQANVGPDGPWYTITKGRAIGVYSGWQNVTPLVTGVGRACFFRYPTQAAAQAAFDEAVCTGVVEIL
ncbi:uncharacterized protein EV420DRAFT_1474312 [Desarmillaria tabescens]|uniref:Ribonuclease H1 N-terminal domain-containing protein n=1 Tax=Armillaria tabescens TaxID=1929756 RepID=A0AA39NJW6_ARMTA|nr:uncharacterized protein EV420DRAFT_1474312 [Desarmillaria tabescens]KAK0466894.1 hypothetical protein EV420DRAFT_1474312 [Desarmillaria tabescens]